MSVEFALPSILTPHGIAERTARIMPVNHKKNLAAFQTEAEVLAYFNRFETTFDPNLVTAVHRQLTRIQGARVGMQDLKVRDAPFSRRRLRQISAENLIIGYMHPNLGTLESMNSAKPSRFSQAVGLPAQKLTRPGENAMDQLTHTNPFGYFTTTATELPQDMRTTTEQLEVRYKRRQEIGMDLPHYKLFLIYMAALGRRADNTRTEHTRLLGTKTPNGNIIYGHAPQGTPVFMVDHVPTSNYPTVGGRSLKSYGMGYRRPTRLVRRMLPF